MKKAIMIILKGIVIGFISVAIPGLSASTIAIVLGTYYLLIDSISSLFKDFKRSVIFLFEIMLGYFIGCIIAATSISKLYITYPLPVILLILGFVVGSLPNMVEDIRSVKVKPVYFIITLIIMVGIVCYSLFAFRGEAVNFSNMQFYDYIILAIVGLITSTTLVVPGFDFAMILLSLGYYYAIMGSIAEAVAFQNLLHNLTILGTYLVSYGIGAFIFSKLIKKIFVKYSTQMKYANLGFVLVAPFVVVQKCIIENDAFYYSKNQIIVGIILFAISFILMLIFNHFTKPDDRPKAKRKRNQFRFFYTFIFHPIKASKIMKLFKRTLKHLDDYTFQERFDVFKYAVEEVISVGRIEVKTFGEENILSEATMYVSNHQGKFDGLGIMHAFKNHPVSFLADKAMINHPLYSATPELIKVKLIDRTNIRSQVQAVNEMAFEIENGLSYLVFPEGDWGDNHNTLQEFHTGFARAAYKAKCPIVPICLYDSWRVFNVSSLKKIYPEVHILEPIYYDEYKDLSKNELCDLLKERIQTKLNEIEREKNEIFTSKSKNK